jgi:hypothetical protein
MITIVLMYQASSCLVGVSHTAFDGLQLPSGISRRTVEKDMAAVCIRASGGTNELLPKPLAKYLAFLDQAVQDTGDSLICYSLEKEDVTL